MKLNKKKTRFKKQERKLEKKQAILTLLQIFRLKIVQFAEII